MRFSWVTAQVYASLNLAALSETHGYPTSDRHPFRISTRENGTTLPGALSSTHSYSASFALEEQVATVSLRTGHTIFTNQHFVSVNQHFVSANQHLVSMNQHLVSVNQHLVAVN
jgi:hypothetical protein